METRERRNKRLGIRERASPLYPTTPPKKGDFWVVSDTAHASAPCFYFTTIKDLIDYLEVRLPQTVEYVRRP